MLDKLKSLTNLADDVIILYLQDVLIAIRDYANTSFITSTGVKDEFEITTGNEITSVNSFSNFTSGDAIELRYSKLNTRLYTVKQVNSNSLIVNESLVPEVFEGFVIKLNFNIPITTIASMISYTKSNVNKAGLRFESLDGYSYTLDNIRLVNGYPASTMKTIKRKLSGNVEREYYYAGFIL